MTLSLNAVRETAGSDFADLSRLIKAAGLMRRRPVHYAVMTTLVSLFFVGCWVMFVSIGESWWQLLTAVLLGVAFTQFGFLGHDAGHRQIFRTRPASAAFSLLYGNLGIGLSHGWWVNKHNRHHAHPNRVGYDPDITPGAVVFIQDDCTNRRGAARLWTRAQAYLFGPLLLLEGIALRVASVRSLFNRARRKRRLEAVLLSAHLIGYLTIVLLVLNPWQALAFIAVQQGVFGLYMGCAFAPNHKGMHVVRPGEKLDYLRSQVLTSRNIRGGPIVDFVLGGLNYQIEHHLFPSMPRPSLRRAQLVVRDFCRDRAVPYSEMSLLASYREVFRHLDAVGRTNAPLPAGAGR